MSVARPSRVRRPSWSRRPTSPVISHPSAVRDSARRVGSPPVAGADVRPPHLNHPDLLHHRSAVVVADPHLDTGQGEPHRARYPGTVVGIRGVHQRLAHPVALQAPHSRCDRPPPGATRLSSAPIPTRTAGSRGRRRHRSLPATEAGCSAWGLPSSPWPPAGSARTCGRIEALEEDHLARVQHGGVECHHQTVHMEDRQGVQQHVLGAERPRLAEGHGVCWRGCRG